MAGLDRARRPRAMRATVAVAGLLCLYHAAVPAYRTALAGAHQVGTPALRVVDPTYQAMREQFTAAVPSGSRVYTGQPREGVWRLWIVEYAAQAGAYLVLSRADADFEASVVEPADPAGVARLVVEPVRR
jgi:hypothetical protein